MIRLRFESRTSSTFSRVIFAEHGPTLSTVSRAAARIAVSVRSRLQGITIIPRDLPPSECSSTLIRPIRPDC